MGNWATEYWKKRDKDAFKEKDWSQTYGNRVNIRGFGTVDINPKPRTAPMPTVKEKGPLKSR